MKRQFTTILVFLLSFPILGHTTTYTTVNFGNWDSPLTWDANGIPDPSIAGNTININHNIPYIPASITTNAADIYINAINGSIFFSANWTNNGSIYANNCPISGTWTNNGTININSSTNGQVSGNWTNNGSISIFGTGMRVSGDWINNGNISLQNMGAYSGFFGNLTNNSGGTIMLMGSGINSLASGAILTNYGTVNIMSLSILGGGLVNQGTINLLGGNSIQTSNTSSNSGTITLQESHLSVGAEFTNSGIIDLAGTTSYIDLTASTTAKFINSGTGTLKGIGYTANYFFFTNNLGIIEPDLGGTLKFLAGLDLGHGTLKWKLKKETNGTVNRNLLTVGDPTALFSAAFLSLDATASTGSKLNISFDNYKPYEGESFDIAYIYGGLSTTFNPVNVTITGGNVASWSLSYTTDMLGTNMIRLTIDAVLPVELNTFKGQNTEGGNVLTWQTATEINNKGFQVERLNPINNEWANLGFVNAQGKAITYTFTDIDPLPTSYYRLRQLDNDGKEELSKVISISAKVPHPLKIYPNVVKDFLTVETDNTDDFVIVNLLGQQVLRGKTAQWIDVSALPQGAYLLRVGSEVAKFVKE